MWMRRSTSRLVMVLGALMVSGLTLIGPASAASTPKDIVERPLSERQLKLLEFTPWLVQKNKGPANAKGVVYFIGGVSPGAPISSAGPSPIC